MMIEYFFTLTEKIRGRWRNMTMVEKRKGGIELSKLQCCIRDTAPSLYIYIYLPTPQPFLKVVLSASTSLYQEP